MLLGTVEDLFDPRSGKPRRPDFFITYEEEDEDDRELLVFDNRTKEWCKKRGYEIPKTYTFTQYPSDPFIALDYYIRSVTLVKHTFVWSRPDIPHDDYGRIRSETNAKFRGRFSLALNLPKLNELIHVEREFVNPNDLRFILGSTKAMNGKPMTIHGHSFEFDSDDEVDTMN